MKAGKGMADIARELQAHLTAVRSTLNPEEGGAVDNSMLYVENFCDVALRIMAKTNPSKIHSEARTTHIHALINGKREAVCQ